jgi:hypothetical protein
VRHRRCIDESCGISNQATHQDLIDMSILPQTNQSTAAAAVGAVSSAVGVVYAASRRWLGFFR